MSETKNYYDILGLEQNDNEEAVRHAYRLRAKQYHPDVSSALLAEEKFKEVNEAYNVLSDPVQRKQYDALIARSQMKEEVEKETDPQPVYEEEAYTGPIFESEVADEHHYPRAPLLIRLLLFPFTFALSIIIWVAVFIVDKCTALLSVIAGFLSAVVALIWIMMLFNWGIQFTIYEALYATLFTFLISPFGVPWVLMKLIGLVEKGNNYLKSLVG